VAQSREAESLTAAAQAATRSTGIPTKRGVSANHAGNPTSAPALLAATTMAEKLGAIRHADSLASMVVEAADSMAAVVVDIIVNFNSTVAIAHERYRNYL